MLKLLSYLQRKEWTFIAFSVMFIVLQVWLDLKLPDYMFKITMLVQTPGSETGEVLDQGVFMLLCAIGSMAAAIVTSFFAAQVAAGFSLRLRRLVFDRTLSFSMEEMNRFSTPSLITRSTNDITQVQLLIATGLQVIVKAPILAVWAIFKITGKSWEWSAATGVAVALLIAVLLVIVLVALPKFRIIQTLTDNLNRVTRENLSGIRVVHAYNAEGFEEQKFEVANEELTRTNLFTMRTMAILMPTIGFIMSGISLAIYWIGAFLIQAASGPEKLTIFSNMVVFSSYAMQVIMAFMMLSIIFILLPRAAVSAKRIQEVLATKAMILPGNEVQGKPGIKGKVEFHNVTFRYPDAAEAILENISFTASLGETVAIIGSTGSGKSTLVNLIPRFFDVTEGEILVDGVDVRNYTKEALHSKIGFVSQKAELFSGSVKSNVAFGDTSIEEDMLKKALEIAQAADFVEKMEERYEAPISQSGTNLSGGQKQRLSIARAIYKQPEIYVFDDSFSALDYKTDRVLRSLLKQEISDATSIIVAQRIGTIKDADRILVLDEGKLVGTGTHEELMETCDVYQEIAYSQLSKEELANG
ncbi:ABC transporter ATP-binding protein [Paenisporosarcina cavernae]|uniref:ABC transporter ATP-binding protein n=1 Tax=Paenisporosarcina cavernae TaxID=2320858 RepID=A0A385YRR5_9BACL|nr:ABC transporter ATP-binding protein [Paenisporosarcina cavernae]AYC28438.1 ABC transporter ATP-binding protein [Paenisporosarcina cavernae]